MRILISCFLFLMMGYLSPCASADARAESKPIQKIKKGDQGKKAAARAGKRKFSKLEAGTRTLIVFPTTPEKMPFSEDQLNRFRSSLSKSDQLGIVVADRKQQLLPLTEKAQVEVPTFKIVNGFHVSISDSDSRASQPSEAPVDIDETIRNAVAQLSDLEGLLKAIVLVVDRPYLFSRRANNKTISTEGSVADPGIEEKESSLSALTTLLALNNIILYSIYSEDIQNTSVEQLTDRSGGKNIYLSRRVTLDDALYMAYDSILLRTIQLAPKKALYEGDEICTPAPDEGAKSAAQPLQMQPSGMNAYVITLLIAVLGFVVVLLVFTVSLWQRNSQNSIVQKQAPEKSDEKKENAAPAFSKLTIGINRVRNSFSDMESKLHSLSSDLDDFGSENWEMQKKIVSAYAEISKELFLLNDHLLLESDEQRSDEAAWVIRKIEQAFEDNGIEEIVPEVGERFHSKYHSHAGERISDEKAGTVLEVVRNGYQRKGFVSDEPFVLRQAEVIVSAGKEQGN